MDRTKKIALITRTLGLRHKLKVHASMDTPDTHEDLAVMLLAKWELEDELQAIEAIIDDERNKDIVERRKLIERDILKLVQKQNEKRKVFTPKRSRAQMQMSRD